MRNIASHRPTRMSRSARCRRPDVTDLQPITSGSINRRSAYSPVAPSSDSRNRSACPLWRAYSSIMCR